MRKGINISHVNIENMGGRDQSQIKSSKKVKSIPKGVPKSHNDNNRMDPHMDPIKTFASQGLPEPQT